jgi:NAD(P)-dependent dehydrogenase (short-subunit alcohol dehydrogenase family)
LGSGRLVSFRLFFISVQKIELNSLAPLIELHVLVNNSGSNWGAPYDEYPSAAWTRVLTLNLHRVFDLTKLLTPFLEKGAREGDPARVLNIGSVDGLRVPSLETFAYSASKAGLHHLSRVLASHLGERNITFVTSHLSSLSLHAS